MSMEYATGMDVGARKRRQDGINEDSIAVNVLEDGHLDTDRTAGVFVLADGAGGEEAGDIASYIAAVEVARRLTHTLWDTRRLGEVLGTTSTADTERRLDEATVTEPLANKDADWLLKRIETAIQSTHTRILQSIQNLGLGSAYTTVVAGVKTGDRFYFGWVGDSRAYVVNQHSGRADSERISLLTRDHSFVERLVQQGEIDEIEAHVHQKGNRITRALGGTHSEDPAGSTIQVETDHVRLFSDDIVLLTSDGLIDAYTDAPKLHEQYKQAENTSEIEETILDKSVTDNEIRDVILDADSLEAAVSRFLTLANERGGKDNLSIILFQDGTLEQSPADSLPPRGYERDSDPIGDRETIIRDSDLDAT